MAARILYCHCAYARVVPPDTKAAVLQGLAGAAVDFDAVPDLCEMAARRDPRLAELAQNGPLRIAACYPRAVRWLFASAGAALPPERAEIFNMRSEPAEKVLDSLLEPERAAEPADGSAGA
jgi:hypothetical protein